MTMVFLLSMFESITTRLSRLASLRGGKYAESFYYS